MKKKRRDVREDERAWTWLGLACLRQKEEGAGSNLESSLRCRVDIFPFLFLLSLFLFLLSSLVYSMHWWCFWWCKWIHLFSPSFPQPLALLFFPCQDASPTFSPFNLSSRSRVFSSSYSHAHSLLVGSSCMNFSSSDEKCGECKACESNKTENIVLSMWDIALASCQTALSLIGMHDNERRWWRGGSTGERGKGTFTWGERGQKAMQIYIRNGFFER